MASLLSSIPWPVDSVTVIWSVLGLTLALVAYQKWCWQWAEEKNVKMYAERKVAYVPVMTLARAVFRRLQHHIVVQDTIRRAGKVFGFDIGDHSTTILISEPELIQQVLSKEFTNFVNRRNFPFKDKIFSKVLFFTEDETWKRLRSIITPTFSAGKMKRMKPLIDQTTETLLRNLDNSIKTNEVVDVKHLAGAFTMDTIVKTAFGVEVDSLNEVDNPLADNARKIFGSEITLGNMISAYLLRNARPLQKLLQFLKVLPTNQGSIEFFYQTAMSIIDGKRKEYEKRVAEGTVTGKASDFIQLMLESEDISVLDNETEKSSKYITRDEMLSQCVLFFLAGYDTTATTITMSCYNLATNPDKQEQLYQEIKTQMEKLATESPDIKDPLKLVTNESLVRFEYLNGVVQETLRLFPPLVQIERRAASDMQLETADGRIRVEVKRGDHILIPIYTIHHDPDNYVEPERFRPERFIGELTHHKYAHIPFGSGPRNCVARSLGLLEAKLAVLHIVRNYQLCVCEQTSVPPDFMSRGNNLLAPRGINLKCVRRG